nr:MAG TPA: hypothetical protein [Caudoviricetes sp.]
MLYDYQSVKTDQSYNELLTVRLEIPISNTHSGRTLFNITIVNESWGLCFKNMKF